MENISIKHTNDLSVHEWSKIYNLCQHSQRSFHLKDHLNVQYNYGQYFLFSSRKKPLRNLTLYMNAWYSSSDNIYRIHIHSYASKLNNLFHVSTKKLSKRSILEWNRMWLILGTMPFIISMFCMQWYKQDSARF